MLTVAKVGLVSLGLKKVLIFPLVIVTLGDVCSTRKYNPSDMTESTKWSC